MRRRATWIALAVLASSVSVARLAVADLISFDGQLAIRFTSSGEVHEVVAEGDGHAEATPSEGGGQLSQLQFGASFPPFARIDDAVSLAGPWPERMRFEDVRIHPALAGPLGQPGIFAPIHAAVASGGALTLRTLPLAGTIRLCDDFACSSAVDLNLTQTDGSGQAVGIGVGGTFTQTRNSGATRVTVVGAPWTVGVATVSYHTASGAIAHLTGSGFVGNPPGGGDTMTSSVNPAGTSTGMTLSPTSDPTSGWVQLVTPSQITTVSSGNGPRTDAQITRITLHFTPEPNLLLLFASGALALAALGRRRS